MTTTWTEANFLERLKVPLKNAHEASASSCPDAEMMTAYVENSASEFVRNAVDEHLKSCANCRELAERLAGFDVASAENVTAMTAAQQAEWVNAEKRLDIEAENFVRTAEVDFKRAARVANAAKEEPAATWQFPWRKTAWSAAAVAALIVAGFFLMRKNGGTGTPIDSAQNTPSAAVSAPRAQSAPVSPAPTTAPPIAVANESGTNTIVIPPNATSGAATETPKTTNHGVIGTTKRPAAKHAEPEASAPAVAANRATDTSAEQPAVSAANGAGSDVNSAASSSTPAPNVGNAVASNAAPPLNTSAGAKGAISTAVRSNAATASRAPRPATAPLPAVIQLSEGTRVWIVFKTVSHTSDTNFAFTGSLLEPIEGAGTTPVPKDAEIDGTGAIAKGKTSLNVLEIVVGGVRYRLKGASGAVTAAGRGSAVEFDAGQVQEMWLSAPATYEKAGDTGFSGTNPQR
jgi:hypothetical protein